MYFFYFLFEALQKKEGDETENDKDLTTEKSGGDSGAQDGGGDSNTGQSNANAAESNTKEDESAASKDGNKTAEEISPLSDEANKKPKKEKVKKKWSFRSISFGKKDKQKPAKAEDAAAENAAATNGETVAQGGEGAATEEVNLNKYTIYFSYMVYITHSFIAVKIIMLLSYMIMNFIECSWRC